MKHTKQNIRMAHRIMAFFLTVCMSASLFSPIVSAQAEESTSNPISLCGFAELSNEIKEQSIPLGVSLEKLNLPDTLEAMVNSALDNTKPVLPAEPDKPLDSGAPSEDAQTVPPLDKNEDLNNPPPPTKEQQKQETSITSISEKDVLLTATPSNTELDKPTAEVPTPEVPKPDVVKTEPVTIHSVKWESSPLYNKNNPATYIFTAVLPKHYILADGVAMPKILITVYDNVKSVNSWKWNDPDGYISEGALALPGVNKENPVDIATLISMLPASILATLDAPKDSKNNAPVPISLAWNSKDFVQTQDGNFPVQGEYKFTATMQEGYTLSANAPSLEITVRLGGAMMLPSNNGTFTTLEIREGTATGPMVVNLLDANSMAENWALKPGADYYIYADLTAPTGAEHIKINYGGADVPNGVTFANIPGGKYEPNKFGTHDYLDELLSYNDLANPTYGPKNKVYNMQDGEMIYHIKEKTDTSTNTVFAIGLVVKDALYNGSGSISNAISVAVGSYANGSFSPAFDSEKTFDLKIAEKGKFNSYLSPNDRNAAIGEKGENGAMQYLANISPDQPEILYEEVSFDLTYPVNAELEIGFSDTSSKIHENLGSMTVGEAVLSADGKTQSVHVIVKNGLKSPSSHGECSVRLNFPENVGFKPGKKYFLTTDNVLLTMGTTQKPVDIKTNSNQLCYTLTQSGQDETSLSSYDRIAYNHTIDAPAQSYLVPLGNAIIRNSSTSLPTPYDKTFEAEYNATNTAVNVSYITIPVGLNTSPTIEWSGVTADGAPKTGTISNPSIYLNRAKTFYFLPAENFGIVSFTSAKSDIGALRAKYTSANTLVSWLFAPDNLSSAYGYFTTNEPGIQVINNYRLYNTNPALRDKPNGDLFTTATGTSSDYCGIGWSGVPSLNGTKLTITDTSASVNPGDIAKLSGYVYPYTTPNNGKGNSGNRGTATLVIDPIIYLTLPQGMSVIEKDLLFEIKEKDFYAHDETTKTISHQIENVSYLNTTGDGVSIYKITFPKGTRLGYFDEKGMQSQLYYTIPLLTSKSLETRRYSVSELFSITAQNQPEATKYGGANQGSINYAIADKYGINGGKSLGTFASEKGNAEGTKVDTPIGFGVQKSSEINLYSAVSVTEIGGKPVSENRWYSHSSDPNSIALLGQNSKGRLRLQVSNTSETAGEALRIILPIPQKNVDLGDSFMDTPSGFTMSMAYDQNNSNANFTPKYIKTTGTYNTITDNNNIVSYTECSQADANAVLFTADTVPKGEFYIYLDFTVAGGTPKSMDIWRPVYAYTVSSDRRVSNGSYVASEVAASSISGVAFADVNRNGQQDMGEDGAANVTVVAKDTKNRIVSTQTDANGAYEFLAIRESVIDMSFALSTEGQKTLRFNVLPLPDTATGIASTVTPAADGITATKTFTANAGRETVNAAVDGFVSLSYNGGTGATGNLPKTGTHVKKTSVTVAVKPDNLAVKGKRFTGWNTKQDGTGTAYQPGASIQMSQSIVLYAQWELASYTVAFNYRGATSGNDEQSRVLKYSLPYGTLPTPAKNGYDFTGWCNSATGTLANIESTTNFVTGADTMLYALWAPKSMTVSYNNNGGSGTITNKAVSWEEAVLPTADEAKTFTKNGYTLSGWNYNSTAVTSLDTYGNLAKTDSTTSIELVAQWKAKSGYTVKYNLDGGTVDGSSNISDKTNVSWSQNGLLPAKNPIKNSFSFKGWKCVAESAMGSSTYGSLAKTDTTMEITLTAQWEAKSDNTVIYDTNGGSAISEKTGVKATDKNLLPTEITKKSGYRLTGWKAGDKTVDDTTVYSTLTANNTLTLTAQWEAKIYTIMYNTNGGSTVAEKFGVKWADSGLLPSTSPTKTGYTFGGWYYGNTMVTSTTLVSTLIPQDDTNIITLTAKWIERTYTVNYNSMGGTTFPQKNNVKYTATGLLPDVPPVKLGYNFRGWKSGEKLVTATTVCADLLADVTDTNVTLTAEWEIKTGFTVKYDTDGGSAVADKTGVKWTDTGLLPATNPTKSGYAFNGWLSGRTQVTNATAFSTLTQSDTNSSITLVAQWKAKYDNTVIYDTNGGNAISDKTGVKATDKNLLPAKTPTKVGYTFVKWQYGTIDVNADTIYNTLATDDTIKEITLKAVWAEKSNYTVKYDSDGGTNVAEKTGVKWTDKNLLPTTNPTKVGYTFVKWQYGTIDVNANTIYNTLATDDTITEITLKAVWAEKSNYTVKYDSDGGTNVAEKTGVKWTDKNLLPAKTPTKVGYTFVKWQYGTIDVNANTVYNTLATDDTITEITLKAVWAEKSNYTVKYDSDGGTNVAEKTGVKWTDKNLLPTTNPTKVGYTFVKWQYGTIDVNADTIYNTLATDDTITEIFLKAVWAEKSNYTVKYDSDGGTNVAEKTNVKWTDKNLLPAKSPIKVGYTFDGWYYNNTKVEATTTVAVLIPLDDTITILLTAHWNAESDKAPDISGTVEDENGNPVENASVKLTQGSETKYGPVTTNAKGQYFLPNLKSGIYNLVAEKNGQIVTVIITIAKSDLSQDLTIPTEKKNSVLVVTGPDTPNMVVGNLEEVADSEKLNGATSLTITLTVQKEAEQTSGKLEHTAIRKTAGANADILFLDAVLTKQVNNGNPVDIGDANTKVLELVIPFDLTGKDNVRVYRHHDVVNPFTTLTAKPANGMAVDQTCYLDKSANLIHVYAQKYSTYAIAYDKKSGGGGGTGGGTSGGGTGGGGSETSYYTITPKNGAGGQITPDKSINVRGGENASFSMVADEGYQIADVKVDGNSVGVTSEYIFTNVWSDHNIAVSFEKSAQPQPPVTKPEQTPDGTTSDSTTPSGTTSSDTASGGTTSSSIPADNKPTPPDNSFDKQKEDINDDITQKRDEAIASLPDTLTGEQRQDTIDKLNKICDDALNAIDSAKTAGEVSDILNDTLQAYRDTVKALGGEMPVSKQADTQSKHPFILLSALLALVAVLLAVLTILKKCTKKRKLLAIIGAIVAVIIFLVTTGWSGIAFANLWTLAVALAAALPAFAFIMQRKEDEETEEDTPQ